MDCNLLPLFELASVQHAQYLLNIRLPSSSHSGAEVKNDLRRLKEISVYVSIKHTRHITCHVTSQSRDVCSDSIRRSVVFLSLVCCTD